MAKPEPTDPAGPFAQLHAEIRSCKASERCPDLFSRAYYFEPNPDTAEAWAGENLYAEGIDRRVMFVCESPGPQKTNTGLETARCWALTAQDRRFREVRERYGFQHCYITNNVKCGVRRGSAHTEEELDACRRFLLREIELVAPRVIVGVGGNSFEHLHRKVVPEISDPPILFRITHYSARGDVWAKWEREFPALVKLAGE